MCNEPERWLCKQLKDHGYSVLPVPHAPKMLMVNGILTEVRVARPTKRKVGKYTYQRWQWRVKTAKQPGTILALIAVSDEEFYPYFVLSNIFFGHHLQITKDPDAYTGELAKFRDNWKIFQYIGDDQCPKL